MADYDFFSPPRSPGTTPPPAAFAPPGAARGWTPAPTGLPVSAPGLGSSAKARQWIVILAVAVGALGAFGIGKFALGFFKPLTTPVSVNGQPKLTSPLAEQLVSQAKQTDSAIKVAALYGTTTPAYLVVAGKGKEKTAVEMWDGSASGFTASAGGLTLGERSQPAGSDMLCAPILASNRSIVGSVCVWGGSRSDGAVLSFVDTDPDALAPIAFLARRAVNK